MSERLHAHPLANEIPDLGIRSVRLARRMQRRRIGAIAVARADHVVVIDDQGCEAVLNGSNAALVWRSCDWELSAFSSDGRLGAGRCVKYGTIGVIELSTGRLVLGIEQDMTPVGPRMVFDEANRLNFRVGNPAAGRPVTDERFAFMVCDLTGDCWFSSIRYADPIEFVFPNRK